MKEEIFTIINVRLQPSASKDEICGWMDDGTLKIRVRSKPLEGKANENLIKLLSSSLEISKRDVEITAGFKSRNKQVKITGVTDQKIKEIFSKPAS